MPGSEIVPSSELDHGSSGGDSQPHGSSGVILNHCTVLQKLILNHTGVLQEIILNRAVLQRVILNHTVLQDVL